MTTRVFLVDDNAIVREGLRGILEREPDIEVVGETGDGRTALDTVRAFPPDVVVMDISLPSLNGIEATRQLNAETPSITVLACSQHDERQFVACMFQAGASGYLLKTEAHRDLVKAIRQVLSGHRYVSPQLIDPLIDNYVQHYEEDTSSSPLTTREREVVQLTAEGKSIAQIATELNRSEKTIANHRQHIMNKLNLHSVVELTRYAIKNRITFLDS